MLLNWGIIEVMLSILAVEFVELFYPHWICFLRVQWTEGWAHIHYMLMIHHSILISHVLIVSMNFSMDTGQELPYFGESTSINQLFLGARAARVPGLDENNHISHDCFIFCPSSRKFIVAISGT